MTKRILVVEDEEQLSAIMKKVLEATGEYIVTTTTRPTEVMLLCQQEQPDMIILDNVMQDMNGIELIPIIKKDPVMEDVLIILASGDGEMMYDLKHDKWKWAPNRKIVSERGEKIKGGSAESTAEKFGVDDFLAKPFTPELLVTVVREVFERHQPKGVGEKGE